MTSHPRTKAASDSTSPSVDAIGRALAELEEGRRRLAAARNELGDPRLVMEMQRLVAERQATLDRVVRSIRRSPEVQLSDVTPTHATAARSAVDLGAATDGDAGVVSSLIRGETATIGALRSTLDRPLPDPVGDAVRSALTQAGRTRDQLELVTR